LSLYAGLDALRAVLSYIVPYIGLAVIVLFQSEIRRTLARLGRKRLFGIGGSFPAPEIVPEIMLAVEKLAEDRIGGLIVLERDIGLRTFIESGVRLEARLSRDLLITIFQPGLPLHDGAVIVQRDRIPAAACFLPLTTNPAVSRKLGTRHRAAIGITEETDCLSIVVSEETGRISVAAFGEIAQGISLAEATEHVNRHFGSHRASPIHIDEFTADIPLTPPAGAETHPIERIKQP
jgi:diadenylate cyclase